MHPNVDGVAQILRLFLNFPIYIYIHTFIHIKIYIILRLFLSFPIYIHIYVYICIYNIYIYVYIYIYMYTYCWASLCTYTHTYKHYIYTGTRQCASYLGCIYVHIYMSFPIHIYMYIYIHVHIYTCTCIVPLYISQLFYIHTHIVRVHARHCIYTLYIYNVWCDYIYTYTIQKWGSARAIRERRCARDYKPGARHSNVVSVGGFWLPRCGCCL